MVSNPRFPHLVQIVTQDYDEEGYPTDRVLFESECGLRTLDRQIDPFDDVSDVDYKLALPKHDFIVDTGATAIFTHSGTGEVARGTVQASKIWNFGANIWFKRSGNG